VPVVEAEPRILISTCTYNERDNLAPLVQEIRRTIPAADVLVLDDNSPDGTGRVAEELRKADPHVQVVHRTGKLGLGTAIVAAMRYALEHDYELFVNMDADFSHSPRYLPALLEGMQHADVMIGSRYVPGGGVENWPWSRQLMSLGVNTLARILMRLPARDTSGGYRCYRVANLRQVPLERIVSRGYSFQEEVLYLCRVAGCRIGETPILFANRRAGASKVNPHEAARSIGIILWVGLRAFFGGDRVPYRAPPAHSPTNQGPRSDGRSDDNAMSPR
jgi:dolichol-phosphate mannosyltransferase